MTTAHGRFVWYELSTTDAESAKAFYAKVVGWGTRDAVTPGPAYAFFTAGQVPVCGLTELLSDAAANDGEMSRWIGYVAVDDVDAAAGRVESLGGTVRVPPTDVPGISRFSIIADPEMATLALVKGVQSAQTEGEALRGRGRIGWHELLAANCETAFAFYRELFGWRKGIAEDGPLGTYQLFSAAEETAGGIATRQAAVPMSLWLYYFNVGDIDAAAVRVKEGGGAVLNGPHEVPDGSWIIQCTDPQNAMFALAGRRSYGAGGFMDRVMPRPSAN
jgi:uncharacterized protein